MRNTARSYPKLQDYKDWLRRPTRQEGGYSQGSQKGNLTKPLVSIITVTYNAAKTLQKTIASVRSQTYGCIEHIIVDGRSTDNTLDIIRSNEQSIAYWTSDSDSGIYDAFNRGIALARGKYIGILNADDYYEPNQIALAVETLETTDAAFVHGDMTMHGWRGKDVLLRGDPDYASKIPFGMPPLHHVTVLCRAELFERCGLFETRYSIAGDYEWFLRVTEHGLFGVYNSKIHAHMQAGGASTTQQRKSMFETGLISWRHGLPILTCIKLTLPRVLFPNGQPILFGMTRQSLRSAFSQVVEELSSPSRLLRFLTGNEPRGNAQKSQLEYFLESRQACATISPLGLEWLIGLGMRSRRFSVKGEPSREIDVLVNLLRAGGSSLEHDINRADICVLDEAYLSSVRLSDQIEKRTILLVNCDRSGGAIPQYPHLDFGALLAFGLHVNPNFSLR